MSASVAISPASGSITAVLTVCRVTCAGVSENTLTGYSASIYPSSPEVKCYFKLSATGEDDLVGPVFSTNADGVGAWDNVIIPAAGTWTLDLVNTADDSVLATASVTVA